MENSEGDIQDFFQRDEPQNNEVDGAVTLANVPTNPNSHVRFNPDIVSYASGRSPQITGIDFAENFQDDENIQKITIEEKKVDEKKISKIDDHFHNPIENLTNTEIKHLQRKYAKRKNKNWNLLRQKFEEDGSFFFSRPPRVNFSTKYCLVKINVFLGTEK